MVHLVNDLISRLNGGGVHTEGYTDNKFPTTVLELTHNALHIAEVSCGNMGLSVNPEKTNPLVFTRNGKLSFS
jgi:hypothetical protein